MSDTEMFQALGEGAPDAFQQLCERYGARVEHIVRRWLPHALRRRMETADVVQTVLGELFESAGRVRFDSERAFLGWLNVVVQRRILQEARRWNAACRRLDRESRLPDEYELADSSEETPSRIFTRKERKGRISAALTRLAPRDREVVVSRLLLQLPWAAVATALDTSVGAAQMRFLRACQRLRAALATLEE